MTATPTVHHERRGVTVAGADALAAAIDLRHVRRRRRAVAHLLDDDPWS